MNKISEAENRSSPVLLLYGTHTGNSEQLAKDAAEQIQAAGMETRVCDMGDFDPAEFRHIACLLVIVSTDGDGEPPLMADDLLIYLNSDEAPRLDHVKYSVLALGDSCYDQFCQAGKDFDALLEKRGAERIVNRVDCDVDYEENYARWLAEVLSRLSACTEKISPVLF